MEFKINVDTYTDGGGKIQTFLTGGCGRHTRYSNSGISVSCAHTFTYV